MSPRLTPIERCKEIAGLAPHEILLGVSPSEKHEKLLASYRRGRRSHAFLRARIVSDIRAAVAVGATGDAADLLIALRWLLALDGARASVAKAAPSRRRVPPLRGRVRWRPAGAQAQAADSVEREAGQIIALENLSRWKKRADAVV